MSSTLARAALVLACLALFACGEETTPPGSGGTGGITGGTGGSGGTGGDGPGPLCGNGIFPEGDEECDDANQVNEDGCLDTCKLARCGDGFIRLYGNLDEIEECDAGADNSDTLPNACRTNCRFAHCGDGVIDSGEVCDDGENNSYAPGACRPAGAPNGFACKRAGCGDGVVDEGEQCDEGEDNGGPTCRTDCTIPRCGDGTLDPGELCDDGNDRDDDSCTNACVPAACGDGIVQPGELCDDGNTISTDYCVWPACVPNVCGDGIPLDDHSNNSPELCEPALDPNCRQDCTLPGVNDGVVDIGEECDDGNDDDTDACVNTYWAKCGDGAVRAGVEECDPLDTRPDAPPCRWGRGSRLDCTIPRLNDGITDPEIGEECDDGNSSPYDGCLPDGRLPTCGDGYKNGTEACDPSDPNNDVPNCRADCTVPACRDGVVDDGEECDDGNNVDTDACRNTCVWNVCGDGVRNTAAEGCDDGNPNSGDGCSGTDDPANACQIEPGFNCTGNPLSVCTPICGDGKVVGNEACDDRNTLNNDGCNSTCTAITTGWQCTGGSPTTPSVCSAICGDGIIIAGQETCDDQDSDDGDECVRCQNAIVPFVFTDFTTANVEATMRSLVKVTAKLNPLIAADFDPNALLRYRITVTKGTAPAAGVVAYFQAPTDGADHTTWSEAIATGADGVAWFGPATGATASQMGIDTATGTETPFSVVFPTDGAHTVTVDLVNVTGGGDVLVGSTSHTFTVGQKKLNVVFTGFDGLIEAVPSDSTIKSTLASSVAGTRQLHWEVVVTRDDGSGNQVGVANVLVNDEPTTAPEGRVILPGTFAASTLHGAGKTEPLRLNVPNAGVYQVRLELREGSVLVGHATTTATVDYDRVVSTIDFDGNGKGFGANIRNLASLTAELDGRYPTDAGGSSINGKWQVTVTSGGAPVEGVKFFWAEAGDGPSHSDWSGNAATGPNGTADLGGLFALDTLKVTGGVQRDYSVSFPTAGTFVVRFDLVEADGTVVDGDEATVTVAPGVAITFTPVTAQAGVRSQIRFTASLHGSFESTAPVQWKLTLTRAGTGEDGVQLYYFVTGNSNNHTTWTNFVTTTGGGIAAWGPEGVVPFAPVDTLLQDLGGDEIRLSALFPAGSEGDYTFSAELVEGASVTGPVIGGGTTTFTVFTVSAP